MHRILKKKKFWSSLCQSAMDDRHWLMDANRKSQLIKGTVGINRTFIRGKREVAEEEEKQQQ